MAAAPTDRGGAVAGAIASTPTLLTDDIRAPGALAALLAALPGDALTEEKRRARRTYVHGKFGWDALRPDYVAMIQRCTQG